jgi:glycerol-3-phosphate dehydrogenase (NAD(P)+)
MKVGVLGAGAWGTALAIISANAGNDVALWSYDGEYSKFEGAALPKGIKITADMADLGAAGAWLVVTPAAHFRETIERARGFYQKQPVIICTKGIEPDTNKFMSEVLSETLPECGEYGVLSGPQFAGEVARGVPTGSTLAGTLAAIDAGKKALAALFLEESGDIIGAEVCGVGKNAVALISGYCSVAARGENEKALIFTRAWNEVVRFGLGAGAKMETFLALCGIGDLFLSATSKTSRNYSAGVAIAGNQKIVGTVEGISALNGLVARAAQKNIDTPILREMRAKMNI